MSIVTGDSLKLRSRGFIPIYETVGISLLRVWITLEWIFSQALKNWQSRQSSLTPLILEQERPVAERRFDDPSAESVLGIGEAIYNHYGFCVLGRD